MAKSGPKSRQNFSVNKCHEAHQIDQRNVLNTKMYVVGSKMNFYQGSKVVKIGQNLVGPILSSSFRHPPPPPPPLYPSLAPADREPPCPSCQSCKVAPAVYFRPDSEVDEQMRERRLLTHSSQGIPVPCPKGVNERTDGRSSVIQALQTTTDVIVVAASGPNDVWPRLRLGRQYSGCFLGVLLLACTAIVIVIDTVWEEGDLFNPHQGNVEQAKFGTAKFGTTTVCQIMPRYLR